MSDYALCFKKGVKLIIKKCNVQNYFSPKPQLVLIYNQCKERLKSPKK